MSDNRFLTLLHALKTGSDKGTVMWQETPDDEMFRAHIAGGMVRIGKSDTLGGKTYALWVLNGDGGVIAEVESREGDVSFQLIEDVYTTARLVARNGRQILDNMLRFLQPNSTTFDKIS